MHSYSYAQETFAEFYDTMVQEVFGGVHSKDMHVFHALLDQQLQGVSSGEDEDNSLRIVDLGCGSGRCIMALILHLAQHWQQQQPPQPQPPRTIQFWGVDNSAPMLRRAERQVADLLQQQASELRERICMRWLRASFDDWSVPELQEQLQGAHLVCIAAGGFHHLETTAQLAAALQRVQRHLCTRSGAVAAISYLPWQQLAREVTDGTPEGLQAESFNVGCFVRTRLQHNITMAADGSCILYERFLLKKYRQQPVREGANSPGPAGAAGGEGAAPAVSQDTRAQANIDAAAGATAITAEVDWEMEEEWKLRRLDENELLQLAQQSALRAVPCPVPDAMQGVAENGHEHERFVFLQRA